MGALAFSLLLSFSLYLFLFTLQLRFCAAKTCRPSSCPIGTEIRFPFRLNSASPRCGYPGFNLSCSDGFPILDLPSSGEFTVEGIDYSSQTISISDPDQCLHRRFLNFNLSGSPFEAVDSHRFTFYNCSSLKSDSASFWNLKIPCLSGPNFSVVAVADGDKSPPEDACRFISTVSIPVRLLILQYGSFQFTHEDLTLTWKKPDCGLCEAIDRGCGYRGDSMEVICSHYETHPQGLSMSGKYGLIMGAGIPGMVLLIGIIGCTLKRMKRFSRSDQINPHISNLEMEMGPPHIVVVNGLDKPTIESFPKTVLGESCRLPNPNDMTCPICLSEYQPKDTLRTIPECKHYFHADCVDEWLKMNATCPLCRNSPDAVSTTAPSSSMASSSSS